MAQTPPELHHLAATTAVTPSGRPAGERIAGRFHPVSLLGRGGLGEVWKCWDELLQDWVAIKVLHAHLQSDASAVRTLQAEVTGLRRLVHPHLVRVFDLHVDGSTLALAMEWIDGPSLAGLVGQQTHGVLDPADVVRIFTPLAEALDYAHREGVLHRDIKPTNILIDRAGEPRLADFGLARQLRESIVRTSGFACVAGTLPYLSPQALYGDEPSPSDDLYAFALSIYECLAGRTPFFTGAIDLQIRERRAPPVSQVRAERAPAAPPLPPAWDRVLAHALGKNPADRPSNAQTLVTRLALGIDPATRERTAHRRRWLAAGTALASAAAIVFLLPPFLPGTTDTRPQNTENQILTDDKSSVPTSQDSAPGVLDAGGPSTTPLTELTDAPTVPTPTGLAGIDRYGLVGHLPMDGNTEGWRPEDLRQSVVGSLYSTADRADHADGALAFNHSTQFALEDVWSGSPPETLTISLWFLIRSGDGPILQLKGDHPEDPAYRVTISNRYLSLVHGPTAIPSGNPGAQSPLPSLDVWQHLLLRLDAESIQLHLNGTEVERHARPTAVSGAMPRHLLLGGSFGGVTPGFTGAIDDLRWYRRAIGDAHLRSLSLAPAIPPASAPPRVPAADAVRPQFALSSMLVSETDDWTAAAQEEFGTGALPADWVDFKEAVDTFGSQVLDDVGLGDYAAGFIVRAGEARFTPDRTYTFTRANGHLRENFLSHDNSRSFEIFLGSSPGQRLPLLVRLPGNRPAPWSADFAHAFPPPWQGEGPAPQGNPWQWTLLPDGPGLWWAEYPEAPSHGLLTLDVVLTIPGDDWGSELVLAAAPDASSPARARLSLSRPAGRPGVLAIEVPGSGVAPVETRQFRGEVRLQIALGDGRIAVKLHHASTGDSLLQQSWPLRDFVLREVRYFTLRASTDSPLGLTLGNLRVSGR